MPKNVRNSWVVVQAEGRKNDVATGPAAHNGRLATTVFVRENGKISDTNLVTRVEPVFDAVSGLERIHMTVEEYTKVNDQVIGRVVYSRWFDR
jgi:hypothetical protein